MTAPAFAGDITVTELKERMDRGDAPMIVDVREPAEFEICSIPGAVLIPLQQLPQRLGELDPSKEIVLQCKVGGRSANATAYLQRTAPACLKPSSALNLVQKADCESAVAMARALYQFANAVQSAKTEADETEAHRQRADRN